MKDLLDSLSHRFGDIPDAPADAPGAWRVLAGHGSVRTFSDRPVDRTLIETLCALALCAPSKSDLQQRDIVIVEDTDRRERITALFAEQSWTAGIPHLLVFCGNNRRQRRIHDWRGKPFANDHLDAFFNAAVDAGIALSAFIVAAEAAGLGCCPISAIRNRPEEVSDILALPDHVFPVAGLALGWPETEKEISLRLPLAATVHTDRYDDANQRDLIGAYDARRAELQPYPAQRLRKEYGQSEAYGWSEDKARQYSRPERETFGAFIRAKGFDLG